MEKVLGAIDSISEWVGKTVCWVFILITLLMVFEVVLRYLFNRPTIWAWDVNVQLMGLIAVAGASYALRHKGHVAIDILVTRLSTRRRALLDVIMGIFLIGGVGLLLWRVSLGSWNSVMMREHYTSTWAPVIYPFKVVMAVGIGIFLLQGIAVWLRNIITLIHGTGAAKQ